MARHLWHQHVKGFRTLSWRQLASIKTRLQAHHSRDRVWLRRISTAMWKKAKDPWRCLNCSKLNRYSIHCCGDWGGHWEDFMDHTYVPPSQQQQQKQAQSSSAQPPQWESSRRSYSTWTQNETWQNQDWDDWEQSSTSSRSSSAKRFIYTAGEATTKTSCATQSTGSKAKRAKGRMPSSHRLGRPAPATPGTYDCHTGSIPCGGQAAGDCHRSQEEGRSGAADACKVGRCLEYEDSHFQASQSSDPTRRCQNCSFMETIPGVCDRDVAFFHRGLRQGGQTLGRAHWESRCRSFNGSAQDSLNEAKKAATEEELKDQIETIEDEDEGLDRTTKSSQVMREGLTDRHVGRPGAAPCQNGGNWRRSRKQTPKGGRWQIQVICHAAFWWGQSLGQEVSGPWPC